MKPFKDQKKKDQDKDKDKAQILTDEAH